jgi:signal transduction histidine kinase
MNDLKSQAMHRIVIIDDNPNIHRDFETILVEQDDSTSLNALSNEVLGKGVVSQAARNTYQLDFASQGEQGCQKIAQAFDKGCPYEVAFVDMRMPPGWDGLKTVENIWKIDPRLQIVICTAYSDCSWADITDRLGKSENLLILKKPFDSAEVAQLASALTEKWGLAEQASTKMEQLENMVKKRTDDLEQINEKLNEEIDERKQAQQRQAELLRTVDGINKDLKDFAYIVSHDLKAPLRGIKSLATWILDDAADQLGEGAKEQMRLLLERVELMHQLIEGVLRYSRASNAKEEPVRVDLNEFVPAVIDMLDAPDNIEITVQDDLPVIDCQEVQLIQLFQNLLSNAIKYMDKPQGRIDVGCTEENGFWKFSIGDNGPGIEERHFERIFKMFQSLSVTGDLTGSGIGLTVVKKIVELHGGSIWLESQVGEGSTFFFTLPKQQAGVDNAKLEANIAC